MKIVNASGPAKTFSQNTKGQVNLPLYVQTILLSAEAA
jgi:hypothetical protein